MQVFGSFRRPGGNNVSKDAQAFPAGDQVVWKLQEPALHWFCFVGCLFLPEKRPSHEKTDSPCSSGSVWRLLLPARQPSLHRGSLQRNKRLPLHRPSGLWQIFTRGHRHSWQCDEPDAVFGSRRENRHRLDAAFRFGGARAADRHQRPRDFGALQVQSDHDLRL